MVPEAKCDHALAVGAADIQGAGSGVLGAEDLLLQLDDRGEGSSKCGFHLRNRICEFPAGFAAAQGFSQECHVQCCHVLGIGGAFDVFEAVTVEEVEQVSADRVDAGDYTIVHDGVSAEDERMVVDGCDGGCSGCSYMSKQSVCGGVGTDGMKIVIVGWRLTVLV